MLAQWFVLFTINPPAGGSNPTMVININIDIYINMGTSVGSNPSDEDIDDALLTLGNFLDFEEFADAHDLMLVSEDESSWITHQ